MIDPVLLMIGAGAGALSLVLQLGNKLEALAKAKIEREEKAEKERNETRAMASRISYYASDYVNEFPNRKIEHSWDDRVREGSIAPRYHANCIGQDFSSYIIERYEKEYGKDAYERNIKTIHAGRREYLTEHSNGGYELYFRCMVAEALSKPTTKPGTNEPLFNKPADTSCCNGPCPPSTPPDCGYRPSCEGGQCNG